MFSVQPLSFPLKPLPCWSIDLFQAFHCTPPQTPACLPHSLAAAGGLRAPGPPGCGAAPRAMVGAGARIALPGGWQGRGEQPPWLAGPRIVPVAHGSLAPAPLLAWAQPGEGPGRLSSVVLLALVPYLAQLFLTLYLFIILLLVAPASLRNALPHNSVLVLLLRASGALLPAGLVPTPPPTAVSSPPASFPFPKGLIRDALLLRSLRGTPRKQTSFPGGPFGKRVCKGFSSATRTLCCFSKPEPKTLPPPSDVSRCSRTVVRVEGFQLGCLVHAQPAPAPLGRLYFFPFPGDP